MKAGFFVFLLTLLLAGVVAPVHAANPSEVGNSTTPIGSSFYRFLAADYNVDLYELVKFEKKGFGRSEIVALVLISQKTGKPLKEYGNRRIKDKVPLKAFAEEAQINYRELMRVSRDIKLDIETRGEENLPPPLFPKKSPASSPPKSKELNDERRGNEIDN